MIAPVTSHDAAAGRQPRPELLQIGPVAQLKAGRLPRRLVQLFVGLSLYGASMGMLVRSALGLDPWDVFHYGVSLHVPWTFGTIVVVISFAVLLLRIPLRQMPGLGTIANAVWIEVATDLTLSTTPEQHDLLPRDGLMTGLHRRTGISLRVVRTTRELSVLVIGWLLGGVVGLGTVLYALAIDPPVQFFLPHCTVRIPDPDASA